MEMITVLGIIGVLTAVSIPMLNNPVHRARKVARELTGDMQQTRMSAIKDNRDWAIVFDTGNKVYHICSDRGADNVWSATGDNAIEKTISFTGYAAGLQYGSGIATISVSGGSFGDGVTYNSNVLTFNPRGTCSSGYVYIFYSNFSYAVGTLSTGIVRIRAWSKGGWR